MLSPENVPGRLRQGPAAWRTSFRHVPPVTQATARRSGQTWPQSGWQLPEKLMFRVAPTSVLVRMVPPSPTARQIGIWLQETPQRLESQPRGGRGPARLPAPAGSSRAGAAVRGAGVRNRAARTAGMARHSARGCYVRSDAPLRWRKRFLAAATCGTSTRHASRMIRISRAQLS